MKKAILTTLVMLASATWVFAQQDTTSQSQQTSANQTTVQGCLSRSSNGFTLTDKSGTTYDLAGDTSKLGDHVGHEVQIKGSNTSAAAPAENPNAVGEKQSTAKQTIDVATIKHISDTCSSKSESGAPPMSEKPPVPPR